MQYNVLLMKEYLLKILYISVETPIYNKIYLEQLFILACSTLGKTPNKEQMYMFYDEIQYLKNGRLS